MAAANQARQAGSEAHTAARAAGASDDEAMSFGRAVSRRVAALQAALTAGQAAVQAGQPKIRLCENEGFANFRQI